VSEAPRAPDPADRAQQRLTASGTIGGYPRANGRRRVAAETPPVAPSILRRVLEAAGYRLEDLQGATIAVRAIDHRAVVLASRSRSPAEVEQLFPASAVHRTVVYEEEPGDLARQLAAERGIEVLDPSALGPALGELLLPSALLPGTGADRGPCEEPLEAPFPPVGPGGATIRPRIGRREAQQIAGIEGARYTLRLVPHYVAAYRVRTIAPDGGPGPVRHRLVAVNAMTRRAEIWDEGSRELSTEVGAPAERLPPQIAEDRAASIAIETIRREHTVRVDHTEQHAGALVVESRRVAPPAESVRLGPLALVFAPFWYAETNDGRRVLDAVSGRGALEADARPG
jgi:hypothetical protein